MVREVGEGSWLAFSHVGLQGMPSARLVGETGGHVTQRNAPNPFGFPEKKKIINIRLKSGAGVGCGGGGSGLLLSLKDTFLMKVKP